MITSERNSLEPILDIYLVYQIAYKITVVRLPSQAFIVSSQPISLPAIWSKSNLFRQTANTYTSKTYIIMERSCLSPPRQCWTRTFTSPSGCCPQAR